MHKERAFLIIVWLLFIVPSGYLLAKLTNNTELEKHFWMINAVSRIKRHLSIIS
jgi:hypothetical protein